MATPASSSKADFPWWLVVAVTIAIAVAVFVATSNLYAQVFATVAKGIGVTIFVTVIAFVLWQVWISVFEGQTFEEVTSTPPAPSTGQPAPAN